MSTPRPDHAAGPVGQPRPSIPGTASWARRFVALAIDWAASSLVTVLFLGPHGYSTDPSASWVTLGVFWIQTAIGTAFAGGSFGQLVAGVRVLRVDHRRLPFVPALARSLLVCLVVPPLVFRPDGRGLHDLAAGSAAFDLKELREGA